MLSARSMSSKVTKLDVRLVSVLYISTITILTKYLNVAQQSEKSLAARDNILLTVAKNLASA